MPQLTPDTMDRLSAANPVRAQPEHGLQPAAQAALARIVADPSPTSRLRTPTRLRSPRRVVLVLAVMVLGAGGALAATNPLGWWSANPGEARYGTNPAVHVRTPSARQIRCHRSPGAHGFRCTPQRDRCGQSANGRFGCAITGTGLPYTKIDVIQAPAGPSFSRAGLLSLIARAVADGTLSAAHATKLRADLARVPDSFFTEYRLASRYATYGVGQSNSRGQTVVPPPGQPSLLVCETAGPRLGCQDLNGDLQAPIGAGVYSAQVGPGWRVAPPHRQHFGLPPGIHFTPAEYQFLFDMLRYTTTVSTNGSSTG